MTGGSLYLPDGFLHVRGHPMQGKIKTRALDEDVARRLWEVSEQLTGVEFALGEQAAAAA